MMQVLDARAADFAQTRERRSVRADPHQKIRPGPGARQGRAKMRRAEENEMVQTLGPRMPGERRVVASAACDEATHAVTDDSQLFDSMWPCTNQPFHQVAKLAAIDGDMTAVL